MQLLKIAIFTRDFSFKKKSAKGEGIRQEAFRDIMIK